MDDCDTWVEYPKHRNFFNKLWVADNLNYFCGPSGFAPSRTVMSVIRPVYNLSGMGAGAEYKLIEKDDCTAVPLGYFWTEKFEGRHISATYKFYSGYTAIWKPLSAWEGFRRDGAPLYKFDRWCRIPLNEAPKVPRLFNDLFDVGIINVEFIGNKVIEVHLRNSPDPDYDELIPVWDGENNKHNYSNEYKFIESLDDGDGFLPQGRLGFLVK